MKKIVLAFLLLSVASGMYGGIVVKKYTVETPEIVQKGDYQKIVFPNSLLTNRVGEPALPYFAVSLLLPPGEKAVSVEFSGKGKVSLDGTRPLWPYQPSRTFNDTTPASFVINKMVYSADRLLPEEATGRLETSFLAGHGFALTAFTPLRYNPVSGKLYYYKEVTITIHTEQLPASSPALKNLRTDSYFSEQVRLLAQNPEMLKRYGAQGSRSMEDYRLLIITGTDYLDSFDTLRNIYLGRGIRSKVYSVDYINNNISGQDTQEKIRNFIIQEFQNHGIEFVLLGGDVEIVPYRGFYCYVSSGNGYTAYDIPADLYYSALDGTWNDDGDNLWGEPDEDDLLPDVAVARMPFSNGDELDALIHKSIWYQNKPVLGEFTKPVFAGEFLYANPDTWGSDYLRLLIGTHSDNGYTTTGYPGTYDIDSLYERYQSWTGNDLINEINQGKEFIHHVGHASETYVAHLYNDNITDPNFYAANGIIHNYTLFYTHGCDCGAFDYDDCILERMVNIHNFAVAVFGNSRYGWFNEGQTEGPAAHLHRETVDALFHDSLNMAGRALMESKIATSPWVEAPGQWEEGALRWNFYDLNVLGDPALSIWTNEPITVEVSYDSLITLNADSIEVHVESGGVPMHRFACAVMKDSILTGYGITDTLGNAWVVFDTLPAVPGNGNLIVSGYNCLPDTNNVVFVSPDSAYIVYADNTISDSSGNNNGSADFGENILLNVALANVGGMDATGVVSTISSVNGNAVITDDTAYYGTVSGGDTVWNYGAFGCTVSPSVPDGEVIIFQMQNTGNEGSWPTQFFIVANAPQLTAGQYELNDSLYGNGNGEPDAGETFFLSIPVSNVGHAACDSARGVLSCNSDWVSVADTTAWLGSLPVDSVKTARFELTVDAATPSGTPVPLTFTVTSGAYSVTKDFGLLVGMMIEDFETGDFSKFEWQTTSDIPWVTVQENPYEGNWCAKSGLTGSNQHSDLFITLTTVGNDSIRFMQKVSSEEGYDFLKFYIDGEQKGAWSGNGNWEFEAFPVEEGTHELRWSYRKDFSVSGGNDCAWIDSIVFPVTTVAVNVHPNPRIPEFGIFPNPGNGLFRVRTEGIGTKTFSVRVYDVHGTPVLYSGTLGTGKDYVFDISRYGKGLYMVYIKSGGQSFVKKLIVR